MSSRLVLEVRRRENELSDSGQLMSRLREISYYSETSAGQLFDPLVVCARNGHPTPDPGGASDVNG